MKKLFIFLLILNVILISCDYTPNSINTLVPVDTLYKQAKELKGIGPIQIGMPIKNIKQINKTAPEYDIDNQPFEIPYEIKYENKKTHPDLKEYKSYSYKIGDFKIDNVKLYFYRDTLYKIYIEPTFGSSDIRKAFSIKYGPGKKITEYEKNLYGIIEERITQIWENEYIIAEYVDISPYCSFPIGNTRNRWFEKNKSKLRFYEWFTIEIKSPRIFNAVKNCQNEQYQKEKDDKLQKEKQTIDKL